MQMKMHDGGLVTMESGVIVRCVRVLTRVGTRPVASRRAAAIGPVATTLAPAAALGVRKCVHG